MSTQNLHVEYSKSKAIEYLNNLQDERYQVFQRQKKNMAYEFIVCTLEDIMCEIQNNMDKNEMNKNCYFENIDKENPCAMYLDYDYKIQQDEKYEDIIQYHTKFIYLYSDFLRMELGKDCQERIILKSDSQQKISFHVHFPDIIFKNMDHQKFFQISKKKQFEHELVENIDTCVYRTGAFRFMYNSKMEKQNWLYPLNYNREFNSELFIKTQILQCGNPKEYISFLTTEVHQKKSRQLKEGIFEGNIDNIQNPYNQFTYKLKDHDLRQIREMLFSFPEQYYNDYDKWRNIIFAMKDLYMRTDNQYAKIQIYQMVEDFSMQSPKFDQYTFDKMFNQFQSHQNPIIFEYFSQWYQKLNINIDKKKEDIKYDVQQYEHEKCQEIQLNPQYKNIFLKSQMGTGKTYQIIQLMLKNQDKSFIFILKGKSLCMGIYEEIQKYDIKISHYKNQQQDMNYIVNFESLHKVRQDIYQYDFVIIDESVAMQQQILSDFHLQNKSHNILTLNVLLLQSKYNIFMDALMDDKNIKFFQDNFRLPNYQTRMIINTYNSLKNTKSYIHQSNRTLIEKLSYEKKGVIISNSRTKILAITKILKDNNRRYYVDIGKYDELVGFSNKKYQDQKEEFLKDPLKYIEKYNINFILYSPSITTGLNIYFPCNIYCVFDETSISWEMQCQQIFRNRNLQDINVYYKGIACCKKKNDFFRFLNQTKISIVQPKNDLDKKDIQLKHSGKDYFRDILNQIVEDIKIENLYQQYDIEQYDLDQQQILLIYQMLQYGKQKIFYIKRNNDITDEKLLLVFQTILKTYLSNDKNRLWQLCTTMDEMGIKHDLEQKIKIEQHYSGELECYSLINQKIDKSNQLKYEDLCAYNIRQKFRQYCKEDKKDGIQFILELKTEIQFLSGINILEIGNKMFNRNMKKICQFLRDNEILVSCIKKKKKTHNEYQYIVNE